MLYLPSKPSETRLYLWTVPGCDSKLLITSILAQNGSLVAPSSDSILGPAKRTIFGHSRVVN